MRIQAPLIGLLLGTLLAAASPLALAANARTSYSKADFAPIFESASHELWKRNGGFKPLSTAGNQTGGAEIAGGGSGGTFRMNVGAACAFPDSNNPASYNYNKVMSFNVPGILVNNVTGFSYAFKSQEVADLYAPYVEKKMAGREKELQKEFKDVKVSFGRTDDKRYTLAVEYSYANGARPGDIEDRIVYFMSKSNFILCDLVTYTWVANEQIWDDYKGPIKGPVSRELFLALNPILRQGDYELTDTEVEGGEWGMAGKDWGERYENHVDHMELTVRVPVPDDISDDQKEAIEAQLQAAGPTKGAQSMGVYWTDGRLWISSVYPYDGMTGKQVMNTVKDFSDDYAAGMYKQAKKILKKVL